MSDCLCEIVSIKHIKIKPYNGIVITSGRIAV